MDEGPSVNGNVSIVGLDDLFAAKLCTVAGMAEGIASVTMG